MSQRLKDISTKRISFVDRAAVRDPEDPTQPRRFLLVKSEDGTPGELELSPEVRTVVEHLEKQSSADRRLAAELRDELREWRESHGPPSNDDNREDTTMAGISDTNYSDAARKAIASAVSVLSPHASHPTIKRWIADAPTDNEPTGGEADANARERDISKSLTGLTEILKAELPRDVRQQVQKSQRELQLEVLKQQNPRGAELYERAHAAA